MDIYAFFVGGLTIKFYVVKIKEIMELCQTHSFYFLDLLLDLFVAFVVLLAEVVAGLLAGGGVSSEEPASVKDFLLAALSPRAAFEVDGEGVGVVYGFFVIKRKKLINITI